MDYVSDDSDGVPDNVDYERERLSKGIVGTTAFMRLCMTGPFGRVYQRIVLRDINEVDSDGNTCVFYAAYGRQADVLEYLVGINCLDLDRLNSRGYDLYTIVEEDEDCLRVLLNAKSFYNERNYGIEDFIRPPYYRPPYTPDLLNTLLEDNLTKFREDFSSYAEDAFVIACEYGSSMIAMECINRNFGLTYVTPQRTIGFTYACSRGMDSIMGLVMDSQTKSFLLTRDVSGSSPIEYLVGHDKYKLRFLEKSSDESEYSEPFRVFTPDEFDTVQTNGPRGTYGSVDRVVHRSTGRNMIIKRYHTCSRGVISGTTSKEIVLTRIVNSLEPHVAVKLYGIIIENGCVHLVQEPLIYDLSEYLRLVQGFSKQDKNRHYGIIMRGLLTNVNAINGLGIQHNDLSDRNIMIDSNHRIRIIDFGLAEYWGLNPLKDYPENSTMTEYLAPPETDPSFFRVRGTRKTLNSDVYSIGSLIMNYLIFGWNDHARFVFVGNEFLYSRPHEAKPESARPVSLDLLRTVDPDFLNLLKTMLVNDPNLRSYAKECLVHEYFTKTDYRLPDRTVAIRALTYKRRVSYTAMNNELVYSDEVYDGVRNLRFPSNSVKRTPELLNLVNSVLTIAKTVNASYDTVVNTITRLIPLTVLVPRYDEFGYALALLVLTGYVFESDRTDHVIMYDRVAELSNSAFEADELIEFARIIITEFPDYVHVVPVVSGIAFVVNELGETGDLRRTRTELLTGVLEFAVMGSGPQPTLHELLRTVYDVRVRGVQTDSIQVHPKTRTAIRDYVDTV
jgi:serine/threonine protein kinase